VPRFYFHICNGNGFVEDGEGTELPDLDAARAQATAGARDVMAGDVQRGFLDLSSFIEVEDERRTHLFTLTFKDVVDVTAQTAARPESQRR